MLGSSFRRLPVVAVAWVVAAGPALAQARETERTTVLGQDYEASGFHRWLWGADYRRTANDNVMIVAMIENPAGVAIVDKIAAVRGIDGIFVASTDLGSFSGFRQNEEKYEALVNRVVDVTQKAGLFLGGPLAWKETRKGYLFFQGPEEADILRTGSKLTLGGQAEPGQQRGVAPIEGGAGNR